MAGAYSASHGSMKKLRVLLLSRRWDASPSQGYPQQDVAGTHFIHQGEERKSGVTSKETTRWQGLASNYRSSNQGPVVRNRIKLTQD